jgi:uncharacterized protein
VGSTGIEFSVYDGRFCLVKLPRDTDLGEIQDGGPFFSVTRDNDEMSIVAAESFVHPQAEIQRGWRALKVKGPLEFELKGVLASLLSSLAEAGISVFAVSTYSTDYIFLLDYNLEKAIATLQGAGHRLLDSQ